MVRCKTLGTFAHVVYVAVILCAYLQKYLMDDGEENQEDEEERNEGRPLQPVRTKDIQWDPRKPVFV